MGKYKVAITEKTHYTFLVEAENFDAAEDKAWDTYDKGLYPVKVDSQEDVTDIYEVD